MPLPTLLETKPRYCKICDNLAPVYGVIDFSETNNVNAKLPKTGYLVTYNKCDTCGTLFSSSFDAWSPSDFSENIYNEYFQIMDPPSITGERGHACAQGVNRMFGRHKKSISVLDYGGGRGFFADRLRELGFCQVESYDPYFGSSASIPGQMFDLVTAFEVLEHAVHPLVTIKEICSKIKNPGALLFSTNVLPEHFDKIGMSWWYLNPRGGHVTLYTRESLMIAFRKVGFSVYSFDDTMHLAFKQLPDFAERRVTYHRLGSFSRFGDAFRRLISRR